METTTKSRCYIKPKEQQKNPKTVFPNVPAIIEYAFTIDNTDYYEFMDFNEIPCERGFNCLTFYNELQMKCSRDYLLAFSAALDTVVNDNKGIKITDIVKLNQQLKERLEYLFETEIAYKLCSVVFFDETENPFRYNLKHGLKKATLFKEVPLDDFFFQKPIVKLIPYISTWSKDFTEYCELTTAMTEKHIKVISTILSDTDKNKDYYKSLVSQHTKVSH
jgi:hypothetical protein